MSGFDISKFTVEAPRLTASAPRAGKRTPRRKTLSRFINGPLDLEWISRAAKLPGKCLAVGLAYWYLSGLTKMIQVRITHQTLAMFGVDRFVAHRALRRLEEAGLVEVVRKPGSSPVVAVRNTSAENRSGSTTEAGSKAADSPVSGGNNLRHL